MKTRWCLIVLAAFLLLAPGLTRAGERPVKLELRSRPGERLVYNTSFTFAGEAVFLNPTNPGTTISLSPEVEGKLTMEQVTRKVAPNGNMDLGLKIDGFSLSLKLSNLAASLGIAGEEAGPDRLIKLPELPLTMTLTPQGKVVAMKGYGELMKRLGLPGLPKPAAATPQKRAPKPTASKPAAGKTTAAKKPVAVAKPPSPPDFEAMMDQVLKQVAQPMFPAKAVQPGDAWDFASKIQLPGMPFAIPISQSSRLIGFEEAQGAQCARVETKTRFSFDFGPGSAPPGMPPLPFQIVEKVDVTTEIMLDTEAGRIVRKQDDGTIGLRMTAAVAAPGLAAAEFGKFDFRVHSSQELVSVE